MLQEVNYTAEVVSSFISTSKAEAESCYAAIGKCLMICLFYVYKLVFIVAGNVY